MLSLRRRERLVTVRVRDARRTTPEIANLGSDALASEIDSHHRALGLIGVERLQKRGRHQSSDTTDSLSGPRTSTNDVLYSISVSKQTRQRTCDAWEQGNPRSVTRCHHVAFRGSLAPHVMFCPYAPRVLYSSTYVGPTSIWLSSAGNSLTWLTRLHPTG